MNGLVRIDKPAGCTSHDVVARMRRILGEARIGHAGTLDPDARGVLLILVGSATRLFPYLSKQDKIYRAVIRLGFSTDTYDASGRPTSAPAAGLPAEAELAAAMAAFRGEIDQVPPPFSAKKVDGRPVHRLARAGREVALAPVKVRIDAFDLLRYAPPDAECEVRCASGTYVRSLAHDLGRALGCGAHLLSLVRTAAGPHTLDLCHTLEEVRAAAERGDAASLLVPLEEMLPGMPAARLTAEGERMVRHGSSVLPAHIASLDGEAHPGEDTVFRLLGPDGRLLGLGRVHRRMGRLAPFVVF